MYTDITNKQALNVGYNLVYNQIKCLFCCHKQLDTILKISHRMLILLIGNLQWGGAAPPPRLGNLIAKNGFPEAPQTSQVPRTSCWANFGKDILDSPRTL